MTKPIAEIPDAAAGPEPLAAFLRGTVTQFGGTIADAGDGIWSVTNPARTPGLFGVEPLRITTDKEASLLDPELQLLAAGTPLLQRLVHAVRSQGLIPFKGRLLTTWSAEAVKARLKDGLLPPRTRHTVSQESQTCLRAVFRVRLQREFVAEDLLRIVVDGEGEAWTDALPLDDAGQLEAAPRHVSDWSVLQTGIRRALLGAETALLPQILEAEAELAETLTREVRRITTYYDEIEATGEYAEDIDDLDVMEAALAALRKERAKLVAEQHHRYHLQAQVQLVSLAVLETTVARVDAGGVVIRFHPLLAEPILPACGGCGRRRPLAALKPEPHCATCLSFA